MAPRHAITLGVMPSGGPAIIDIECRQTGGFAS